MSANVKTKLATRYLWTSCFLSAVLLILSVQSNVAADPCGMVPPIYVGNQSPIARIGLQKTYCFHKDGVETFVIRPGFSGDIDNFGMLIPFPNPPELRKVPDNVFEQIANAIDPPEVVVDLTIKAMPMMAMARGGMGGGGGLQFKAMEDRVVVHKQEAVGMYEVAVLSAGSAAALKKWIDQNGFQYPKGMDKVTNEYVDADWCFVAVKTKVANKSATDPQPGQRKIDAKLAKGSTFDGNVQAMGFRFKSDELVVPMRLSAFNEGDLRNVVYMLTDGPRKIRSIPEEYVVRQISGKELYNNVTQPLPLRIIGGNEKDIPEYRRSGLPQQRKPEPKNGVARDLFAADLLAVSTGNLSLEHEEKEKELLRIGEHFGLRGAEIDALNAKSLKKMRDQTTKDGLAMLKGMTLTVVDGDFPRDVIARENLTFAAHKMPRLKNNNLKYDAKLFGPGKKMKGKVILGSVDWKNVETRVASSNAFPSPQRMKAESSHLVSVTSVHSVQQTEQPAQEQNSWWLVGFVSLTVICIVTFLKPRRAFLVLFIATIGFAANQTNASCIHSPDELTDNIAALKDSKTATDALKWFAQLRTADIQTRVDTTKQLIQLVKSESELEQKGWAIAAIGEIGGQAADEQLLGIHFDKSQDALVRTWAAAARVANTETLPGLIEKANLIREFPAIGRPISKRVVENLGDATCEQVMEVTQRIPALRGSLASTIFAFGTENICNAMYGSSDQNIRRSAAGYLGAMANKGEALEVSKSVISRLEFDSEATIVPWEGGALFLPGLQWGKDEAKELARNLVCWHTWCMKNNKPELTRQIHNNLNSLALAQAAGYQINRGRRPNAGGNDIWLDAWATAFGKGEANKIRREVGVK